MPQSVKRLFWEYNTDAINYESHKDFIIERVLEKGNMEGVVWLFKQYSITEIKQTIFSSCNISTSTLNFWSNFFVLN